MRRQERKPKRSIVSLHPNGWHKVNLMPHTSEIERTWHTPNPAYPHVPGLFETPGGLVKPRSILVETGGDLVKPELVKEPDHRREKATFSKKEKWLW
jgi:hypothetical protein